MTRVLFVGDLDLTGFGSVTVDLGTALLGRGLDVRFVSQNDLGTLDEPFASRTLDVSFFENSADGVTGVRDVFTGAITGIDSGRLHSGEPWGGWNAQAIILLGDFYATRFLWERWGHLFTKVPTFHYCPIEGESLPPLWNNVWSDITPVAMSAFGQREIARVTGATPPLAYHGVDTTVFHPVSIERPIRIVLPGVKPQVLFTKADCRRMWGCPPAAKVILRTDRNMPRKGYGGLLRAMVPVLQEHRDAVLVLHCRPLDQGGYIPDDISKMPVDVRPRVVFSNAVGAAREVLSALYNAADVYVSTSAEGFGLTIAEAIACGVPAVGLDYSAVPEVIGPAGVVVPVATRYDNQYAHEWATPDEDEFARSVSWFLSHPAKARSVGAEGPKHVARSFRWDRAAEVFHALVEDAQAINDEPMPPEAGDFVFVPLSAAPERELVAA